ARDQQGAPALQPQLRVAAGGARGARRVGDATRRRAAHDRGARRAAARALPRAGGEAVSVAGQLHPVRAAGCGPEGGVRLGAAARRADPGRDVVPAARALPARQRRVAGAEPGLPRGAAARARGAALPTGLEVKRAARIHRKTRETDIRLALSLDGDGRSRIQTGIGFLDHMLTALATHARL